MYNRQSTHTHTERERGRYSERDRKLALEQSRLNTAKQALNESSRMQNASTLSTVGPRPLPHPSPHYFSRSLCLRNPSLFFPCCFLIRQSRQSALKNVKTNEATTIRPSVHIRFCPTVLSELSTLTTQNSCKITDITFVASCCLNDF